MNARQGTDARTLAAEVRGVEEGHQARRTGDPRKVTVASDTWVRVKYNVGASMVGETIVWTCDHNCYDHTTGKLVAARQPARGFVPCKHATRLARQLEAAGLVRWDSGRWVPTDAAVAAGVAAPRPDVSALLAPRAPGIVL